MLLKKRARDGRELTGDEEEERRLGRAKRLGERR